MAFSARRRKKGVEEDSTNTFSQLMFSGVNWKQEITTTYMLILGLQNVLCHLFRCVASTRGLKGIFIAIPFLS